MSNHNTSKIINNAIFLGFFIFLIGYGLYNSRIFIAGPQINVSSPENGATITESPLLKVKGTAKNIAFIELNGKSINTNADAEFDEPILLYPGYNIITIRASDKFDRKIERKIEVVYSSNDLDEIFFEENNLELATSSPETSTSSPATSLEEI